MIEARLYLSMRAYASRLNASWAPYARMEATEWLDYVGDMTMFLQLTDPSDCSTKVAENGCFRDTQLALHRQLRLHVNVPESSSDGGHQDGGDDEYGREDDDGEDFRQ